MYGSLEFEHSSTVERVAESLRHALFAGELAPATPLREVGLAEQLGVARSTVREALTLLTGEGLVTRKPNRGVAVTSYDRDQVHDLVGARLVVERAGAHAWPDAQPELRDAVRTALSRYAKLAESGASARDITEAHLDFHRRIVGLTGNERLSALADQLYAEIRLALAHLDRLRSNARAQIADHRRLLELIETGDADAVDDAMRAHLDGAETSIREALLADE
ncbi:GntR family transcriptional regulator [Solicola gregarius]|uniref:GntR family transcriptional regulator n=1 Tax=Solicola gregarius TaxID=2908642 RepID=A0AA46TKW5_9ACTN|nr:GntR family transcriptional regulator [Solicola gregarius]UYM07150.1 GntR family transcriptional regulator [Solicola gregarius]